MISNEKFIEIKLRNVSGLISICWKKCMLMAAIIYTRDECGQ